MQLSKHFTLEEMTKSMTATRKGIDNRVIYADKSLATYIQNDKMEIKARKLQEIRSRKQQILIELEVLKNG